MCRVGQVKEGHKSVSNQGIIYFRPPRRNSRISCGRECRIGGGRMRLETSSDLWCSYNGVLMSLTDGRHQTQWEKVDCLMVRDVGSGRNGR